MNDSVRLVEERVAILDEDRVTEIQAAAQNSIQKVNTEITYMREQLAARQLTEDAVPNQVLPVTDIYVENSSQSISGLVTSAGNNHMAKIMLTIVLRPCVATLNHNQVLRVIQDLLL